MRRLAHPLTLALAFIALAGGPALADLCARGVTAPPVPMDYVLEMDRATLLADAYDRTDWGLTETDYDFRDAVEAPALRDVLAARAADLPQALRDLPYLYLIADAAELPAPHPETLTTGPDSLFLARTLDALDRNALTAEARLLREAVALFPDWGDAPADRARQLYTLEGEVLDPALNDALADLALRWPAGPDRIRTAADALIASDPASASAFAGRHAAMADLDRMYWLIDEVYAECLGLWWTPEEADVAHFSMASPQAALILMDSFVVESLDGSAAVYFSGTSGTMAPHLARVLDWRGLSAHAAAIRKGMAVFPGDYPRDADARAAAFQTLTPEQTQTLIDLTAFAEDGVIEADMLALARQSGLLPP